MKKTFAETRGFAGWVKQYLPDEDLTADQKIVLKGLATQYKEAAIRAAASSRRGS
jgi:hypothetical protein